MIVIEDSKLYISRSILPTCQDSVNGNKDPSVIQLEQQNTTKRRTHIRSHVTLFFIKLGA